MHPPGEILIDRHRIDARVRELAAEITAALGPSEIRNPKSEITLVPILTGSLIFLADLVRHLPLPMRIRLISVSSYPGDATTSRGPRLRDALTDLPASLAGQHVLVVDDILDTGQTLALVRAELARRAPASLRTCVLLRKDRPDAHATPVDHVAFDIPDRFVVGYGLDHDGYHRNLPDIVELPTPTPDTTSSNQQSEISNQQPRPRPRSVTP